MCDEIGHHRSPWLHLWAWALVCTTFPLVWWGGFVTATGSGMAFREWLRPDGHFLLTYPWLSSTGDKFIEHGHRLLGVLAGFLTIVVAAVALTREPRRWVRRYSLLLLAAVVGQGALGGLRVVLDRRALAFLHGCTGPAFLALCAGMVVVTAPSWQRRGAASNRNEVSRKGIQTASLLAVFGTFLAYGQLVLGAAVRHGRMMTGEFSSSLFGIATRWHVAMAFVVVAFVAFFSVRLFQLHVERPLAATLSSLIVAQIVLGIASWLVLYGQPTFARAAFGDWNFVNQEAGLLRAAIVTAHGAVGSLILALSTVLALRLSRRAGAAWPTLFRSALETPKGAPA